MIFFTLFYGIRFKEEARKKLCYRLIPSANPFLSSGRLRILTLPLRLIFLLFFCPNSFTSTAAASANGADRFRLEQNEPPPHVGYTYICSCGPCASSAIAKVVVVHIVIVFIVAVGQVRLTARERGNDERIGHGR